MLFVLGSMAGGGAERSVAHLVRRINRDEFEARVGLLWKHGPYLNDLADDDLVVPRFMHGWIPYRDRPSWWHLLPSIALVPLQQREIINRFDPDILVTATKSMNIAGRASLAMGGRGRIRWIVREGNNTGAMIDNESRGAFARLQNALVSGAYRRADLVVAISDGVADGLTTRFKVDRSHIRRIFNAVDLETVRARAAEPLAMHLTEPFIVAAGRLDFQKGFDVLLRAYQQHAAIRSTALVILGEGSERPALEQLARELGIAGRVHFPGFVANPWAYFSRAALFVCPSRWEGFGNVIIEAMASGAPVVATDCDFGPREIVRDGESGLLVPAGDVSSLGRAIADVLGNPPLGARLAAAARLRAEDFGVETMTRAYESLFRELMARP